MTHPRRLFSALACACLFACLVGALEAQCSPLPGSPQSGPSKQTGTVRWRDPFHTEVVRTVEYAIGGGYQRLAFVDCPAPNVLFGATSDYDGVELLTETCYVKISEPAGLKRVVSMQPGEVVALTLGDVERYGPVVLGALREHLGLIGPERQREWGEVAKATWEALRSAARRPPQHFADRGAFASLAETLPAGTAISGLVAALRDSQERSTSERIVLRIVYELAAIDPDGLPLLTELTKLPFIVANRTIGGAEGTEIVVHIVAGPGGGDDDPTADVYYFFLWSDKTTVPIRVCGVRLLEFDGLFLEYGDSRGVLMGEFARLHLVQQQVNGQARWYLDGPIHTAKIDDIVSPGDLAAFQAVQPSYNLACSEGLAPKSPLTYLGVTFTCP